MGRRQLNWKALAGYLCAAGALVWVFHDVQFSSMASMISRIGGMWLIAAVAFDVLSYICQGERWRLLLRAVGELSLLDSVRAIYAGLFTNEVIPLRFGEVVRAYVASKAMRVSVASLIPSVAVERLMDSFWMAVAVAVLLLNVPLPPEFARAAEVFGAVVAVLVLVFLYLVVKPPVTLVSPGDGRKSRVRSAIGAGIASITRIGLSGRLFAAVAWSLALLLCQAAAFRFVMIGCRLPLDYRAAIAVFLIVHLGTAMPNAPANVGTFQFFTVMGLQLFGIDKSTAAAFSVIVFAVLTLPLWVLGLAAVSSTGVTLARMREVATSPQKQATSIAPNRFQRLERIWPERLF